MVGNGRPDPHSVGHWPLAHGGRPGRVRLVAKAADGSFKEGRAAQARKVGNERVEGLRPCMSMVVAAAARSDRLEAIRSADEAEVDPGRVVIGHGTDC